MFLVTNRCFGHFTPVFKVNSSPAGQPSSAHTMSTKTKLSKGILEMKFMKRTRDKVIKEEDDEEGRAMYASQITDRMLRQGECPYIVESSFVPCENLKDGRFSFRGMNPEIERLLELEELARQAAESKTIKRDVSDQEMADHYYGNLANTMAKAYDRRAASGQKNHPNRRKMNLPDPVNHQSQPQQHQQNNQQHQGRHINPKRPRFIKPDDDDQ